MPPSMAQRTEERESPPPSRSLSSSRASGTTRLHKHTMTARCGPIEDSFGASSTLNNSQKASTPRSASSRPLSRTQSPTNVGRRSRSCAPSSRISVQRWAGLTRSVCSWDGLRRDPELWLQDGDCAVHLYAKGASRRGASFSVPLRALRQKRCGPMLDICYAQTMIKTFEGLQEARLQTLDNLNRDSPLVQLYIPAPENASREESFDWHLATRNFFAFVLGKPLVGHHMGQTYVDLFERMEIFRSGPVDNHHDFLEYAEAQGYRDLVECTDYALASLYYAERYKLKDVWIDAFTHCVGMNDSLAHSPEYVGISRLSKALITRAHLEVDLHLDRVARALRSFLEDDFSPTYLGLSDGARTHLHTFQRFLHQFYAAKFGYWPPPKTCSFPKALYKSLLYDFTSLYDLLVDTRSAADIATQKPASGGLCVLQTIDQFDRRHKFNSLPHCLPLLPDVLGQTIAKPSSTASGRRKTRDLQTRLGALEAAMNTVDPNTEQPIIVQAYKDFEKASTIRSSQREERITTVDARKVRWLVIYGTLQYLTSALRAPSGVRDIESPDYPLCCLVAGQPSWNTATPLSTPSSAAALIPSRDEYFHGASDSQAIQPDCHREDYFAHSTSRRDMNPPGKSALPSRNPSIRSFGPLVSLSARSSRRNSLTLKPTSHCPIMVRGYGDGLIQATSQEEAPSATKSANASHTMSTKDDPSAEVPWLNPRPLPAPELALDVTRRHTRTRTPLLNTMQLEQSMHLAEFDGLDDAMSRSDSTGSKSSSFWSDEGGTPSSKVSSVDGEQQQFYKASTSGHSGLLGGLVSVDGTRVSLDMPSEERSRTSVALQSDIHPLFRNSVIDTGDKAVDLHDHHQHENVPLEAAPSIGLAFSAPPSPPLRSDSSANYAPGHRTMSIASQLKVDFRSSNDSEPVTISKAIPFTKIRSPDFISSLIPSRIELRECYNRATKASVAKADPPIVTMTSHAQTASLRDRDRHGEIKEGKKEKRLSSLWRRTTS